MQNKKFLFISHSEKDGNLISDFVSLLYDMGLKDENIFCSSISTNGVPIKEDIYEYLRNLLDSNQIIPLFMLSENYYHSPACLNEMGAVWVKQKNYFTFLLPDFEFKQIRGAINPNKKAIKLESNSSKLKADLSIFKDEICSIFGNTINSNRWESVRDDFIRKLGTYSTEFIVDLSENRGYCIGEINYGGCDIVFDAAKNMVVETFNFSKTASEICSLVFFTGETNAYQQFCDNRPLSFSLKSGAKHLDITVEIRLKNRDVQYNIEANNEWADFSIPLQSFGGDKFEWEVIREVKFLLFRKKAKKGTIQIKGLKIK